MQAPPAGASPRPQRWVEEEAGGISLQPCGVSMLPDSLCPPLHALPHTPPASAHSHLRVPDLTLLVTHQFLSPVGCPTGTQAYHRVLQPCCSPQAPTSGRVTQRPPLHSSPQRREPPSPPHPLLPLHLTSQVSDHCFSNLNDFFLPCFERCLKHCMYSITISSTLKALYTISNQIFIH